MRFIRIRSGGTFNRYLPVNCWWIWPQNDVFSEPLGRQSSYFQSNSTVDIVYLCGGYILCIVYGSCRTFGETSDRWRGEERRPQGASGIHVMTDRDVIVVYCVDDSKRKFSCLYILSFPAPCDALLILWTANEIRCHCFICFIFTFNYAILFSLAYVLQLLKANLQNIPS